MEYFGLKLGQDLGNRAAHPYQEFRGVHPGAQQKLKAYKPWASSNDILDGNKANQMMGEFNLIKLDRVSKYSFSLSLLVCIFCMQIFSASVIVFVIINFS